MRYPPELGVLGVNLSSGRYKFYLHVTFSRHVSPSGLYVTDRTTPAYPDIKQYNRIQNLWQNSHARCASNFTLSNIAA
jgi:hypothetical protein